MKKYEKNQLELTVTSICLDSDFISRFNNDKTESLLREVYTLIGSYVKDLELIGKNPIDYKDRKKVQEISEESVFRFVLIGNAIDSLTRMIEGLKDFKENSLDAYNLFTDRLANISDILNR